MDAYHIVILLVDYDCCFKTTNREVDQIVFGWGAVMPLLPLKYQTARRTPTETLFWYIIQSRWE